VLPFAPSAIRFATDADDAAVRRIAQLDSQGPMTGPVLLAEDGGTAVAAFSLADGRIAADPFRSTLNAVAALRVRAGALQAAERTPSLGARMRAAVRVGSPATAAA
jgi:hypothetical protein